MARWKLIKLKLVLCFLSIGFIIFTLTFFGHALEVEYKTVEGEVVYGKLGPAMEVKIFTEEGNYIIKGEYKNELKAFRNGKVRVSGAVSAPETGLFKEIKVMDYHVLDAGYSDDRDWAWGEIKAANSELVLVGDNQVIYELSNVKGANLYRFVNRRIKIFGRETPIKEFRSKFNVAGYSLLGEDMVIELSIYEVKDKKEEVSKQEAVKFNRNLIAGLAGLAKNPQKVSSKIETQKVENLYIQEEILELKYKGVEEIYIKNYGINNVQKFLMPVTSFSDYSKVEKKSINTPIFLKNNKGEWSEWRVQIDNLQYLESIWQ